MRTTARGVCALAALLGLGCVPDDFSYGSDPGDSPGTCDRDECQPTPPLCQDPWNGSLDGWQTRALSIDAERSRVLATGLSSADGREPTAALATVARCDGATDRIVPAQGGEEPSEATGMVLLDETVLVSVNTPTSVAIASLDALDLTRRWSLPIAAAAGSALDAMTRVEVNAWAVGQSGSEPFAVIVGADQSSCSFGFGPAAGAARGVAVSGASVLVAGELSGSVVVWRFDDAGCGPPACACAPAASSAPLLPPAATGARVAALVVAGQSAYVGGSAERADGSSYGFVLAFDVGTLASTGSLELDPTPGADAVLALASDGKRVMLGGASAMSAAGALETGSGFVAELALPLAAGGQAAWITPLPSVPAVSALALDAEADGALVVGTLGAGGLRRCSKLGACLE